MGLSQTRREEWTRLAADDRRLMERIVARDEKALEELYQRYSGMVMAVSLRILRNRADAEEVLIDTFFELWNKPDRYDAARGTVFGFLMLKARSRTIDRLRARRPDEGVVDSMKFCDGEVSGLTPVEEDMLTEIRAEVRLGLVTLVPEQRESIEMAFFEGLSHSQISERLGIPLGTVKTRIRQGFLHLREHYGRRIDPRDLNHDLR